MGWGGGGGASHPLPLSGLCEVEEEEQEQRENLMWRVTTVPAMKILFWSRLENQLRKTRAEMKNVFKYLVMKSIGMFMCLVKIVKN